MTRKIKKKNKKIFNESSIKKSKINNICKFDISWQNKKFNL